MPTKQRFPQWMQVCVCVSHVAGNILATVISCQKCCRWHWNAFECFDSGPTKPKRFYSYAHIILTILSGLQRRWCRRRIFITKPKVDIPQSTPPACLPPFPPKISIIRLKCAVDFKRLANSMAGNESWANTDHILSGIILWAKLIRFKPTGALRATVPTEEICRRFVVAQATWMTGTI